MQELHQHHLIAQQAHQHTKIRAGMEGNPRRTSDPIADDDVTMSGGYMSRLFPKSNSSLLLHSGTALKSIVHRLRDDKFLLDSGIAAPKLCLRDALTQTPSSTTTTAFHNKVGFMGKPAPETEVNRSLLERYFIDIVAGDPTAKAMATARVFDLIGSVDESGSGNEPLNMMPRKYRQKQALMELNKLWRQNKKVNGFILEKVRGGYLVAIGGYIAFLRFRPLINQKIFVELLVHHFQYWFRWQEA